MKRRYDQNFIYSALVALGLFLSSAPAAASFCEASLLEPLGARGFLSPHPAPNAQTSAAALEQGLMYWGTRIFVMPSLEAAKAHHEVLFEADLGGGLMTGIYLISQKVTQSQLADLKSKSENAAEVKALFRDLAAEGAYEFRAGVARRLEDRQTARFVDVSLKLVREAEGHFFYQRGWHSMRHHGVILLRAETFQGSGTIKKVRRFGRRLLKEGYSIDFNHPENMRTAVEKAMAQTRKGQQSSRLRPEDVEHFVALQQQEKAYNVVLKNSQGEIVAGLFGEMNKGIINGDSVFYPTRVVEGQVQGQIEYAKVVALSLLVRAHQSGFRFFDAQMVSTFTRSLRGEYIPRDEFRRLMEERDANVTVDFSRPWSEDDMNWSFESL